MVTLARCAALTRIMEFVEMFKAPIKVLHPLLTATQEGNYNGTEGISALPFNGIILAHSNESEWVTFRNNKNNEAFLDRVYIVKVPCACESPKRSKSTRNYLIIASWLMRPARRARWKRFRVSQFFLA